MRARISFGVIVCLVALTACADDPATTGPSMLKDGVARPGRTDLPGTANATLEWLGADPGATGATIPLGINALGVTVGYAFIGNTQYGVVFDPARILTPPVNPPGPTIVETLTAINDAGVASGRVNGQAALYVVTGPAAGGVQLLPDPAAGGSYAQLALDVNNHGDAVGILGPSFGVFPVNSAVWPATGGVMDLGLSNSNGATAVAPNLTGAQLMVVGYDNISPPAGWVWNGGTKTNLPGINPRDVADNGWIVGEGGLLRNGVVIDLSLPCAADVGMPGAAGFGKAISFMGANPVRTVVAGECDAAPYVWYDDGQGNFDGEFLPLFPGDAGGSANDVNTAGQIVGYSGDLITGHALRWTFTPPPINTAPTANAGGPYTGNEGAAVTFNGAGSTDPENNPLTYAWNFGDGSTGTGVAPSHSYADNGSYTVTLTVNDGSLSHTATTTATIANVAPSGVPSAPTTIGVGVPFVISIAATDPGSVDAASLQYRFNCGSGWGPVTSTPSTTCTLGTAGTYTLRFSVRDKDLATALYQRTITATTTNVAPVVTLTSPSNVTISVGGSVTVTGTFTDAAGDNPWTGRMFWGAGQPSTSLGSVTPSQPLSATRTFTTRGVYAARLEVKDKFNATGRANVTITVQ